MGKTGRAGWLILCAVAISAAMTPMRGAADDGSALGEVATNDPSSCAQLGAPSPPDSCVALEVGDTIAWNLQQAAASELVEHVKLSDALLNEVAEWVTQIARCHRISCGAALKRWDIAWSPERVDEILSPSFLRSRYEDAYRRSNDAILVQQDLGGTWSRAVKLDTQQYPLEDGKTCKIFQSGEVQSSASLSGASLFENCSGHSDTAVQVDFCRYLVDVQLACTEAGSSAVTSRGWTFQANLLMAMDAPVDEVEDFIPSDLWGRDINLLGDHPTRDDPRLMGREDGNLLVYWKNGATLVLDPEMKVVDSNFLDPSAYDPTRCQTVNPIHNGRKRWFPSIRLLPTASSMARVNPNPKKG